MKQRGLALFVAALLSTQVYAADEKAAAPALADADKLSYTFGYTIGNSLKQQGVDINNAVLEKGIKDALAGTDGLLTEEERGAVISQFQQEKMRQRMEEQKAAADKNLAEGTAFLAENAKKEGVTVLESGLQYKVITAGTGESPKATDKVTTHYRGTLLNGEEFDSSYKRNKPASFAVNGVIKGWTEALQLMKKGAKWQLFIPANLAYGERGTGGSIGPNSTLIFEVELLEVNAAPEATAKK